MMMCTDDFVLVNLHIMPVMFMISLTQTLFFIDQPSTQLLSISCTLVILPSTLQVKCYMKVCIDILI